MWLFPLFIISGIGSLEEVRDVGYWVMEVNGDGEDGVDSL